MREPIWRRIAEGVVIFIWILVSILAFSSGWDEAAAEIYDWWGRKPGAFSTGPLVKLSVFSAVSVAAVWILWPHLNVALLGALSKIKAKKVSERDSDLQPVRDAWKAKPPSSNYQISMPDLFKAALDSIDVYKFANKDKPRIIAEKLYDALKNGHMRSWGQQSNFYPPSISHPRPAIKAITHSFWDNNTIEELEAAAGRHMIAQSAGWDSITLPDTSRFDRSKAECFWNLVFERDEVRRTFPRREGYY